MKKKIFIFMLVFILSTLLADCNERVVPTNSNNISYTKLANFYDKNQETNTDFDPTPKMIASIPEEKIYLYALQEQDGWYKGMVLSINGVNKFFDWRNITFKSFMPKLHYLDLNNDNKKELVVILIHNKGTGIYVTEVHILNTKNLCEYKVKDALDIIKENVETKIVSKKEVDIKINDIIYNVKIGHIPQEHSAITPSEVSEFYYEDLINYSVRDNTLNVVVGVEVKEQPLAYLGFFIIDYYFKDGEFKANRITFKGNPTVTVTTKKLNKRN
ncbi:hypothetical protein [Anaeromicrobium sediminis]|uniref:Uncharacterized protein n=1 Tax=Anaeromicrobium sediminis TaxID=1478221 RepID=A0A267MKW9_9FIRM|nr:hypothetical protein [Anaeromicrobium sediminis]PAB60244.1 hypothetical protein CCE28_04920 [Anaeromicrobium sediminis]